ncbi:MAG: bifunctional phosphoribosyl-AMP cyclohydrolase/phosphoribosyl-ATP diphosphatase HisIE [Bacteroidota bacterium]
MDINTLNFEKLGGLIPAVVQHATTDQVLMVGFMNRESLEETIRSKRATFWSRTRRQLWQKGETSGNTLNVESIETDCDNDALLVRAVPEGPVCHTGTFTCFGESAKKPLMLDRLEQIIEERKLTLPENSYTASLFRNGTGRIAQKVGEEAVEVVVAGLQGDRNALAEESADLLYHLFVFWREQGISKDDVEAVLEERMKK